MEGVIDAMKVPILALKEAINKILLVLEKTVEKIKSEVLKIKRLVTNLGNGITKFFK